MRIVIAKITLLYLSIWVLCGCSTEAMSFSQGFLEGYNEKMREDRYIKNQIKILRELRKDS